VYVKRAGLLLNSRVALEALAVGPQHLEQSEQAVHPL
jgi:hypothetical protein